MSKRRARLMRAGTGALVAAVFGLFLFASVAGAANPGVTARPPARATDVTLPPGSVPPSQPTTTTTSKDTESIFGTEVRVTLAVVVVAFAIAFFATRGRRAAAREERETEDRYAAESQERDEVDGFDDDEPADGAPYDADDDEPVGV